jgi:hypothetical protein
LWHASIERVSQRKISPGIFPGILWVLRPLRSHLSEEGARLVIGRNLRQLQAMSGQGHVLLSGYVSPRPQR